MCALVCSLSASLFYRQTTLVMIQILCDQISDIMPSLSKVCQTMLHKVKKIFICIYNNSIQKTNTDTQWPPISSSSSNVCIPRHCAKCLQSVSFYFLAHDLNQCHMQHPGFMHFKNLINYFFFLHSNHNLSSLFSSHPEQSIPSLYFLERGRSPMSWCQQSMAYRTVTRPSTAPVFMLNKTIQHEE